MMKDKVYIFSKEEFMILAAVSGIEQMYGFSLKENIEDQEALLVMQALAKKEILFSKDGKFQLQEKVAQIFSQIKNAKTTIDVHKQSGRKCIVYMDGLAVKVSLSKGREEMLEVQCIPLREVWKHLSEEGWIPEEQEGIL